MPEDSLLEVARAPIVQEARVAVDGFEETDAPEGRGAPFIAVGEEIRSPIGERRPHVVEQEIGKRVDGLVAQRRERMVARGQGWRVARVAARAAEQRPTFLNARTTSNA